MFLDQKVSKLEKPRRGTITINVHVTTKIQSTPMVTAIASIFCKENYNAFMH